MNQPTANVEREDPQKLHEKQNKNNPENIEVSYCAFRASARDALIIPRLPPPAPEAV